MLPAKHSSASMTDGQTDRQTDDGQSDPYVSLCFAGDTKISRQTTDKVIPMCRYTLQATQKSPFYYRHFHGICANSCTLVLCIDILMARASYKLLLCFYNSLGEGLPRKTVYGMPVYASFQIFRKNMVK